MYSAYSLEFWSMFRRHVKLTKSHSFFLFGPRGCGKSTLLQTQYKTKKSLYLDLLESRTETRYHRDPDLLYKDVKARKNVDWVIIDEVQKVPKLLDLVHKCIEEFKIKFILTGSSARKLKRGGANLLAGRAFLYHLYPLTAAEIGDEFDLEFALKWGTMPSLFALLQEDEKTNYLFSYTRNYIREEILVEQIVRNVEGFRAFLEIAAQMNTKPLNFSKISRDVGVDSKTVQTYYQILEDTLIGFILPAYHRSVRKAQSFQPKFYFFDIGVVRSLDGTLGADPAPGTSSYGCYFESFVINEIYRVNSYSQKYFMLSHYETSTSQEIDLILTKAKKIIAIEIKSSARVDQTEVAAFERRAKGFAAAKLYYLSNDSFKTEIGKVKCLHWQDFLNTEFTTL